MNVFTLEAFVAFEVILDGEYYNAWFLPSLTGDISQNASWPFPSKPLQEALF